MKIKELHLRNIASIERADIDFEKGLFESETLKPANIFLISGDTGTGKSVILDGISMALYKTTPRVEDVSNQRNNKFYDEMGEPISINSIEQYTRLGTSDKDECYSELVFVGNDNIEYRAKLELGYYMTRKVGDKERHLKYRNPAWTVKVGDADWTRVEQNGQPILGAIGLTFSQFSRMAMLAQGQFAAFLTGTKDEREKILEQLTNTERFTIYGKAIHNLFTVAKTRKAEAEHLYTIQQRQQLEPEEEQRLREELERLNVEENTLANKLNQVKETIDNIDSVNDCQKRQQIAVTHLDELRTTYMQLMADLAYRDIEIAENRKSLEQLTAWLDERKALDEVYTKAETIVYQVKQYAETGVRIKELENKLQAEKGKTSGLADALKMCEANVAKANAEQKAMLEAIEALQKERDDLKPSVVNKEIMTCTDRKHNLENLQKRILKVEEKRTSVVAEKAEIGLAVDKLKGFRIVYDEAQRVFDAADKAASVARSLLSTMQMSLDEKLTELRKRLLTDHAETCPLCGQHLDEQHLRKDFQEMLTPIQKQEEEATGRLAEATASRDKAKTEYDNLNGVICEKQKAYDKSMTDIANEDKAIALEARKLGLDSTGTIAEQIVVTIAKVATQIAELVAKQKRADTIQANIDQLTRAKKPLDVALSKAEKQLLAAQNVVDSNQKDIRKYEYDIKEQNQSKDTLAKMLTSSLGGAYPKWATDTDEVMRRYTLEAKEYCENKKLAETKKADNEKAEEGIKPVRSLRDAILVACGEWKCVVEPKRAEVGDVNRAWSKLHSDINYDHRVIAESTKETARLLALLKVEKVEDMPEKDPLVAERNELNASQQHNAESKGEMRNRLKTNEENRLKAEQAKVVFDNASANYDKWNRIENVFGGTRFRTLVQTYILRPLLNNANIYLERITDRYTLTCSEDNEQLAILVLDRYNKNQVRSVTVLSGGERFMISLALSLALSSLNCQNMNINILFIDEGFGTLDETSLNSVMSTLERLQEIAGQTTRRVGIISHREELAERIPVKINVRRRGEGRSIVDITNW